MDEDVEFVEDEQWEDLRLFTFFKDFEVFCLRLLWTWTWNHWVGSSFLLDEEENNHEMFYPNVTFHSAPRALFPGLISGGLWFIFVSKELQRFPPQTAEFFRSEERWQLTAGTLQWSELKPQRSTKPTLTCWRTTWGGSALLFSNCWSGFEKWVENMNVVILRRVISM